MRDTTMSSSEQSTSASAPQSQLIDDQTARQIQRNRLLAKARYRDGQSFTSSQATNQNSKRTIAVDYQSSRDGAQASAVASSSKSKAPRPLPNMIGKFVDYDLTTLKNSKGGFLLNSEEDDARVLKQRRQIEELKKQRIKQAEKYNSDPAFSLDSSQNPKCKVCGVMELDLQLYRVFRVPVCHKCRNENPERFSLLTKTECKEDYLLTDPELKDTELLPHLLKANPHQSTYSNMMLFLREQVEEYAFSDKKWGSPQALDEEFERREAEKRKKKNKKFENQLKELRKRTRSNVWHKRQEAVHVHTFNDQLLSNSNGVKVQKCSGCGLETECEVF